MKLTEIKNEESAFVTQIEGNGSFRPRLGEMGFVKGQQIKRLYASPIGNPIVFEIMGSKVALRKQEAASSRRVIKMKVTTKKLQMQQTLQILLILPLLLQQTQTTATAARTNKRNQHSMKIRMW